jgi:hypothetical protein
MFGSHESFVQTFESSHETPIWTWQTPSAQYDGG